MARKRDELISDLHFRLRKSHIEKFAITHNLDSEKIEELYFARIELLKKEGKLLDYLSELLFTDVLKSFGLGDVKENKIETKNDTQIKNNNIDINKKLDEQRDLMLNILETFLIQNCEFIQGQTDIVIDKIDEIKNNPTIENINRDSINERLNRLKERNKEKIVESETKKDYETIEMELELEKLKKNRDLIDF